MSALPPNSGHKRFNRSPHLRPAGATRDGDAETPRRFLVDKELKFRWQLAGQIRRLCSFQNFIHEARATPVQLDNMA
jgi:hypothetical protein